MNAPVNDCEGDDSKNTLHISYLPTDTKEDDLIFLFKEFGVKSVKLVKYYSI